MPDDTTASDNPEHDPILARGRKEGGRACRNRGNRSSGSVTVMRWSWAMFAAQARRLACGAIIAHEMKRSTSARSSSWIIAQPSSDQRVVGFGVSYSANAADWWLNATIPRAESPRIALSRLRPLRRPVFPRAAFRTRIWVEYGGSASRRWTSTSRSSTPMARVASSPWTGQTAHDCFNRRSMPGGMCRLCGEGLRRIVYRDDRPPEWAGWSMDDWGIHGWREKRRAIPCADSIVGKLDGCGCRPMVCCTVS